MDVVNRRDLVIYEEVCGAFCRREEPRDAYEAVEVDDEACVRAALASLEQDCRPSMQVMLLRGDEVR
jgi:hypothetical protein